MFQFNGFHLNNIYCVILRAVYRGGRTKGEHLGAKGQEERKDFEMGVGGVQLQSKKEQLQTQGRADTGRNAAGGGDPSADDLKNDVSAG